jgi:hypothetical protein
MSGSSAKKAGMQLGELVEKYLLLAGDFGKQVALDRFALGEKETERLFGAFDDDYHISRFFQFTLAEGARFTINGEPETHVAIDAQIDTIL